MKNFVKTSWGTLWIQSNLQLGRPFRMRRGMEYAKDHRRIENLSINPGQLFATVQGTAPTPYRIKINFEIIPDDKWIDIIQKLAEYPLNLIELLEGKLPQDTIKIFEENGFSLFPKNKIEASCSCPDKAIPCKHIAALILYIGRTLDYNPLLLLELRGRSKNEIFNQLRLTTSSLTDKQSEFVMKTEKSETFFNVPKLNIHELSSQQDKLSEQVYDLNFNIRKPGKFIETVENLGTPQNVDNPAFEIVLKKIYKKVTFESYRRSLD